MQSRILVKRKYFDNIILDLSVLTIIYLLPAFSHLLPLPVYLFEPMRVVLFLGYLFSRNSVNICFLAITIPLFSMITSGHPVFLKALLISVELGCNILFFIFLYERKKFGIFVSLLISILLSKIIYYSVKFILVSFGLISGNLVSTELINQVFVLLLIIFIFSVLHKSSFWENKTFRV